MPAHNVRIVAAFAVIYFVWGSTYLAIDAVVQEVPPMLMVGARFSCAGGLLYALARFGGAARPTAKQWRTAALLGVLFFLFGNGGVTLAEAGGLPSSAAALCVSTVPLWVLVLDRVIHRGRRFSVRQVAGIVLGFGGVAILVGGPDTTGVDPHLAIIVLVGAAGWGLGSTLAPKLSRPSDGALAASMQMLAGGAAALGMSVTTGESPPDLSALNPLSVVAFAYLVVFGSIVAFRCYLYLLDNVAPTRVSTYAFVNPAVAAGLGIAVGEPFGWRSGVAMTLVVGAVALSLSRRRFRRPASAPRPSPSTGTFRPQPR